MYEWAHICNDIIYNGQEMKKTTITFLWLRMRPLTKNLIL